MDLNPSISKSYQTGAQSDRIQDLIELPHRFTTLEEVKNCQISAEEIEYLLRIANCPYATMEGYRFEDFFSNDAIGNFHDKYDRPLPGFCIISGKNGDVSRGIRISPPIKHYELSEQKQYLLFRLIPEFSAWLARFLMLKLQCEREANPATPSSG